MDSVPFTPARPAAAAPPRVELLWLTRQQVRHLILAVAIGLALTVRLAGLTTSGFSDDEMAKVQAVESYRHGDFTANAEHPMVMKFAIWASLDAIRRWNAAVRPSMHLGEEAAVRLPNAIAGVATVIAVYAVGELLFGPAVGLTAAALVALDPNITAINRIGKEDTLMMFFFLLAVGFYERAKVVGVHCLPGTPQFRHAQRWYQSSAAAFGLMIASKYMPHFWGIYALFNHVFDDADPHNSPIKLKYNLTVLGTFVAANWAILLPATWRYCVRYVLGDDLQHHGFPYAHHLWVTDVMVSPLGVPWTYYVRLLATKVPVLVLVGAMIGLVPLVRQRHERGYVWLRMMLLLIVVPYSLMAAKFERYSLPLLLLIDILAAVGVCAASKWLWERAWARVTRASVCTAVYAALIGVLMVTDSTAAPFYSLNQNAIGARLDAPASTFPEEAYDYGIREAVRDIETVAHPNASIVSDVPRIVQHYLGGRSDLRVRSLSMDGIGTSGEQWVLVQPEHVYFENALVIDGLRRQFTPWREYHMKRTTVLQVFRLNRSHQRTQAASGRH